MYTCFVFRFLIRQHKYTDYLTIGRMYRQIQILVILSDQCFQDYLWPIVQFLGGLGIILLFYALLVFHQEIHPFGIFVMCTLTVSVTLCCCLMLIMGSSSILYSRKILMTLRKEENVESKWAKRFYRSCPPIALKVGQFHKMDRERVPAFIRFILHRTFVLVLRTRLSLEKGAKVNAFLPNGL